MKIAYASDFHFEFYHSFVMIKEIIHNWKFDEDTEMIIIAGDLHLGYEKVIEVLEYIYYVFGIHVLYVPGNHEYYNSSFKEENKKIIDNGLIHDGYSILLNNCVDIGDISFFGCVGNIDGSYEDIYISKHGALNDFRMISDFSIHKRLGIQEYNHLNNCLRYIDAIFENNQKKVVITHTMPSPKCINKKYHGNYLNACFCNDWEELIKKYNPEYWICGHTHDSIDMVIDETKVLCNPYGYPRQNLDWEWKYINV